MNWTGGRLQRHSGPAKGHGELTQRQRLHFAKARTQLHHSQHQPPSPFKPQFLPSAFSNFTGRESANALRRQRSTKPLSTLDHHATAPAVTHHERPAKRHIPEPSYRHVSKPKPNANIEEDCGPCADSRPVENRSRYEIHPQVQTARVDAPQTSRRRAHGSNSQSGPLGDIDGDSASARLKAEKTRLLASHDWVGLSFSRPLHMAASGNEKQDIGKRRQVKMERTSRQIKSKKYQATVPMRPRPIQDDGPYMSGAIPAEDDIRIRIGTDALATQSFVGENNLHEVNSAAASSDEMLFDMEARMESMRRQDGEFGEHNVGLRSSIFERANNHNAADRCEAEHVPHESIHPTDHDTQLADIDRLLQQLEKRPSCFPMPHDSCSGSAAHTGANVHASPDELERHYYTKYPRTHKDSVTVESLASEASGDHHPAYQNYGQGAMDPVTIRSTFSLLPVHLADRYAHDELNPEDPKASLGSERNNGIRSRISTAQPLLHEAHVDNEATALLDETAWRKFVHVKRDVAVQSLDMQQADSGRPGARGDSSASHSRSDDESYHVHSGAMYMYAHSAAQPIGEGRDTRSGELEQIGHPTVRNAEADGACSSSLHRQMSASGAVAAAVQAGFQAAFPYQTDGVAKNATPRREKIFEAEADADKDAIETIWKRFVLGSDESEPQYGERRSPEKALRSAVASIEFAENGMSSSLFVQRSFSSASSSSPLKPLVANSHDTVHQRHKRAKTAAARVLLEDSTDELPMSIAVEEAGKTTADGLSSNDWPDTLEDSDALGYPVSSDMEVQSNLAVASTTGKLAGFDSGHGRKMKFSKPKPFGSSTATSASDYSPAGHDNSSTGTAFSHRAFASQKKT